MTWPSASYALYRENCFYFEQVISRNKYTDPSVYIIDPGDSVRSRKGELKREQLRQAAYRCFRDDGYHETTVDAICQRAGSSKGSFYWHYSSKQEVFIDILDSWSRQVMDELYEQFEDSVHETDYVSAIKAALVRELRRGRVIIPLWLEFTLQARADREMQQALAKFYRRARLAITEIMRPMLEDRFSDAALRGVAATIFGAYAGLLVQDMSDPRHANADEMIEMTMSVIGELFHQLGDGTSQSIVINEEVETGHRLSQTELDDFLDTTAETTAQFLALRTLVLETIPLSDERLITGWKQLAFDLDGLFCYLKPMKQGVRLGFQRGAELDDAGGLLKGKGKKQRYIDFTATSVPNDAQIRAFLRQASHL